MMLLPTVRRIWIGVGSLLLLAASTQLLDATSAPPALVPFAPQQVDPQVFELGRGLYTDQCEPCHGADGKGGGPAARFLETPPADLTTGVWTQMESTTLEGLVEATAKGVPGTDMEAFEELLTEEEILAVASYLLKAFAVEEESR